MLLLVSSAFAAPEFHVEASGQFLPQTVALDVRGRMDGEHDGYLLTAVRVEPTGAWLGRAGVGLDVFGGGDGLDLRLGLFLGGTGNLLVPSVTSRPAAGFEGWIGAKIGRVYGSYRHLDGFAGPLEDRLTEDELRVGFRVSDHVGVHGQYIFTNPGDRTWTGGAGLGAEVIF